MTNSTLLLHLSLKTILAYMTPPFLGSLSDFKLKEITIFFIVTTKSFKLHAALNTINKWAIRIILCFSYTSIRISSVPIFLYLF